MKEMFSEYKNSQNYKLKRSLNNNNQEILTKVI